MMELHPTADRLPKYWAIYKENVDPLIKVLHIPTIEPTILQAQDRLDRVHKGLEALLFAIYYGVATSMTPEECLAELGEEKKALIIRYRVGLEQALARADFLQTDEMIILQAFVIFLICLRRNDDARLIWTFTGLVVRMAQSLGIHRDGSHFDLKPFDIEMRRRLWWNICLLDARSSEDFGCDPTIIEASFDCKMPANLDDEDISPDMASLPESKLGCTQMTFGLIRFEIANVLRRIQYTPPGPRKCNEYFANVSLQQKEQWINEVHKHMEEAYLKHCDMSVPLYWVTAMVARLIMSKMGLMIYHPYQRMDGGTSLPQETKDKLFLTSLENVEYAILLETEERVRKWGWLFRTYVQWHAIAFLLVELCHRTRGEYVDRAWRAVETMLSRRWGADTQHSKMKSHLWRPLRKLMAKAAAARHADRQQDMVIGQSFPPTSGAVTSVENGTLEMYPDVHIGENGGSPSYWLNRLPSENSTMNLDADLAKASESNTMSPLRTVSLPLDPFLKQFLQNSSMQKESPLPRQYGLDDFLEINRDAHDSYMNAMANDPGTASLTAGMDWSTPTSSKAGLAHASADFRKKVSGPTMMASMFNNTDPSPNNPPGQAPLPESTGVAADGSDLLVGMDLEPASPELDNAMLGVGADGVNWGIWDDMVQQFGMEMDQSQDLSVNAGPAIGGFQTWY